MVRDLDLEQLWRDRIEECRQSGLSAKAWCLQNGLKNTSYHYWVKKFQIMEQQEMEVEFKYFTGFAISQKQKSIMAMHESINQMGKELKVLEVSTKSTLPIGVALSAFNLKFLAVSGTNTRSRIYFNPQRCLKRGDLLGTCLICILKMQNGMNDSKFQEASNALDIIIKTGI